MKKCTCCCVKKPLGDYSPKGSGGFYARCKNCCGQLQNIRNKHKRIMQEKRMKLLEDCESYGLTG